MHSKINIPCRDAQTLSEICTEQQLAALTGAWQPIVSVIFALLVVVLSSVFVWKTKGKRSISFACYQLNMNFLAIMVTGLVFMAMRNFSQAANAVGTYEIAEDGVTIAKASYPLLGTAVSPSTYIILAAFYMVIPLYIWWSVSHGSRRNTGVKNEELFE